MTPFHSQADEAVVSGPEAQEETLGLGLGSHALWSSEELVGPSIHSWSSVSYS